MRKLILGLAFLTVVSATALLALDDPPPQHGGDVNEPLHEINPPAEGSVTREEGLAAWGAHLRSGVPPPVRQLPRR